MHRWSSRQQLRFIANIQLVPYLDLLFVLLFICILVAPLLSPVAVNSDAQRPTPATPSLPSDYVVLEERTDGSLILNGRNISSSELRDSLASLIASRPTVAVVLNLDPTAAISRAVSLSSKLRLAGVRQIAINSK
jgi:biopolymer transport protein ExbD